MYVKMDPPALRLAPPKTRVLIGFAGPYGQLLYMLALGRVLRSVPRLFAAVFSPSPSSSKNTALRPSSSSSSSSSGYSTYAACMMAWQLLYFVWYTQFFFDDCYSDFAYFVRRGSDQCPEPMDGFGVAGGPEAGFGDAELSPKLPADDLGL